MPYKKIYHTLVCPECKQEYQVLTPAYLRKINGKSSMLCTSCRGRKQLAINCPPEKREEIQKNAKARYDALSDEQKAAVKAARTAGTKKMWANMSKEEREEKSKKRSKDRLEQVSSWTEERRKEIGDKISKGKKEAFEEMDPESREEWRQKKIAERRQYWESLTDDDKSAVVNTLAQGVRKMWENMSDDERERRSKLMSEHMRSYWDNIDDEKYSDLMSRMSEIMKQKWEEKPDEEKQLVVKRLIQETQKYWSDPQNRADRSAKSKEFWNSKTIEERDRLLIPLYEGRAQYWETMTPEERDKAIHHLSEISKAHWANLSPEEYAEYMKKFSEAGKARVANMSPEEFQRYIAPLNGAFSKWYYSLSNEEKSKYADSMRTKVRMFWDQPGSAEKQSKEKTEMWANMSSEQRKEMLHKMHTPKAGGNNLAKRFETQFIDSFISNHFYFKREVVSEYNSQFHSWDYGIYDKNDKLAMLVDLDGAYYHADNCEYDGIHSQEERDEVRTMSVDPENGVKTVIILELKFRESFESMIKCLMMNYDEFINDIFKSMRELPFPEIRYSEKELISSMSKLIRLNCSDGNHQDISLNTRNGDHLIQHFHRSIFHAHVGSKPSPWEAWYDDKLLLKCIRNRVIYQNRLNPNKILQGFNVSKIAPKVSVFSAGRAKMIVSKYLAEYDTVFDPFSGFSGRMLGTVSLGKRYIGQDISEIHVRESNDMIQFLQEHGFNIDATITQQDVLTSSGEYPCLFTCPPYGDKEQWSNVPVDTRNCDDWIDECLSRFKCKRYVFVVDETIKYNDHIVDTITNQSHFGTKSEKIIMILSDN